MGILTVHVNAKKRHRRYSFEVRKSQKYLISLPRMEPRI